MHDRWKPQTGRNLGWQPARAQLRVDHGLGAGDEVALWYDAMVANCIARSSNRADTIRRLLRALQDAPLLDVANNAHFLAGLPQHPTFVAAQMHTASIGEWTLASAPLLQRPAPPEAARRLAAALRTPAADTPPANVARRDVLLQCKGQTRSLPTPPPSVELLAGIDGEQGCSIDDVRRSHRVAVDGETLQIAMGGAVFVFTETSPGRDRETAPYAPRLRAPVAGVVVQVNVAVGDVLAAGRTLVCVEAMKKDKWMSAGAAGTVRARHVKARDAVAVSGMLLALELSA